MCIAVGGVLAGAAMFVDGRVERTGAVPTMGPAMVFTEAVTTGEPPVDKGDLRRRLAAAEGSIDKEFDGYSELNERSGALGRYQMTPIALQSVGVLDSDGHWTGKYGVSSPRRFLASRHAQERVLSDFLEETERQLDALDVFRHVGAAIDGKVGVFVITRAGLLAAGHRAGAAAVRDYLEKAVGHRFVTRTLDLADAERAIETRLRTFEDCHYPASPARFSPSRRARL